MSYNGYPNRATWNVSLWLNNDEALYRAKRGLVESARSENDLRTALRGFAYATWPNGKTPDGDSLAECDFMHLAANEWEDRTESVQTESEDTSKESISLADFIKNHSLKFEYHNVYTRPDGLMDGDMWHYRCRIKVGRRGFGLYFSQGKGIQHEPTLAEVLDCLASDAAGYENSKETTWLGSAPERRDSFESWCSEYGYDTDSRKAEKLYRAVKRQAEQLKRTIGAEAYEELLWHTERL